MTFAERADELAGRVAAAVADLAVDGWPALLEEAGALWAEAITAGESRIADRAWFVEAVARARDRMVDLFADMRAGRFREAWPKLEEVELAAIDLRRNPFLDLDLFAVPRLAEMVERWQALYPYRVFASPEMVIRREECSVCGRARGPFDACTHKVGRVYDGVMCSRIVRDFEFLSISVVTDPVQKFSVLLLDPDVSDYSAVAYVAERVSGPFAWWTSSTETVFHEHSMFERWPADRACPCASGRLYQGCCLELPGVRLPHTTIRFDAPLPPGKDVIMVRLPAPKD